PFLIASVVVPCPAAHLGPAPLSVRLLSCRIRPGMEWAQPNLISSVFQSSRRPSRASETDLNSQRSGAGSRKFSCSSFDMHWEVSNPGSMSYSTPPATPSLFAPQAVQESSLDDLSPYLLFHIHGGGFVALNSQAQDIFLRTWAEFLDCPIFSVNYSLAPQAPYPRALEECFFAYCWVTQNLEKLGCKPDARIVLCGDSAGGNLVLGLCMRVIHSQILARPSGALIAYAPILISFCPTPARMLSLADPLLPIGILSKCIMGKHEIFKLFCLVTYPTGLTAMRSPKSSVLYVSLTYCELPQNLLFEKKSNFSSNRLNLLKYDASVEPLYMFILEER
ncbi:Hormone-sensitive lipase, partial [Fasciolopsis buskii]